MTIATETATQYRRLARTMVLGERQYDAGHPVKVFGVSREKCQIAIEGRDFTVKQSDLIGGYTLRTDDDAASTESAGAPRPNTDEQAHFAFRDGNNSRLIVEERTTDYRIGIETDGGHRTVYFYPNHGQYRLFIESEARRLTDGGQQS